MNQSAPSKTLCIDFGVAARPMTGEAVCGDTCLVRPTPEGVLLAVIDGAGHGPQAAAAAADAVNILEHHLDEPLAPLFEMCHEALLSTRGAAMTVVSIHAGQNTLQWLAVGNVWGCLFHAGDRTSPRTENVLLRGGIIGYHLPRLRPTGAAIAPGDWIVVATDGIHDHLVENIGMGRAPLEVARRVLSSHFKGNDDALVLAARYTGNNHE